MRLVYNGVTIVGDFTLTSTPIYDDAGNVLYTQVTVTATVR